MAKWMENVPNVTEADINPSSWCSKENRREAVALITDAIHQGQEERLNLLSKTKTKTKYESRPNA